MCRTCSFPAYPSQAKPESATLCAAIIYGLLRLCGRIYREGILRVGKKRTLPEIAEWIRKLSIKGQS